ncbi:MAG: hypothetical protein PSU93_07410 [Methylobacter sp.]|uniref:RcnB family protein n=1 Tax=Candidatus Methylobacter titanis TaxID=3053457 RepID=A0AA43Q5S4_9GAMM|nr:hypothetical protein [Candidatus Methylobacter titanis]
MQQFTLKTGQTIAFVIAAMLATGSALADKPSRGDHGKADKHQRQESQKHSSDRGHGDRSFSKKGSNGFKDQHYFGDRHRVVIHDYYAGQFRSGRCPPGLAKKHNGCMPPGQAKQWAVGRQLPRNVIYYDLPPTILMQLGPPPPRHRYVRVADDILLITIGTGLVMDAISDLSWR